MLSRFPGKCAECRRFIKAGDQIDYDRASKRVTCADCMPPVPMGATPPAVVHVTATEKETVFRLDGRLGDDAFRAFRSALTGCRYSEGVNYLPKSRATGAIVAMRAAGITISVDSDSKAALEAHEAEKVAAIIGATERTDAVDAVLAARGGALYRYQREGVAWLAPRQGALVADDMGLGKTIQALTAAPANAPIIVVCPAVAKSVWEREAAKWRADLKVAVLSGRGSFRAPAAGEMVCVNYDILSDEVPALLPGTVLILDEAHACASVKTQRTKRVRALSKAARDGGGKCWVLTATPLKNRPTELWNVLEAAGLAREAFGSWTGFLRAFNGTKGRWGGYVFGNPTEQAAEMLRRVALRRCKADVLNDLPAKTYRTLPAPIDRATAKACDEAIAEIIGDDKQLSLGLVEKAIATLKTTDVTFEKISAARAALAKAKIPAMLEVVESYEEQGEPLVVFSAYRAPIDLLAKRGGWAVITGDTSNERRGEIVDAFQAGNLKGVACTIRAGGVAITLTRASNVLRVDREWNPALNVQAEDRCYRIGQKSAVLVTDLVAEHKLDEMIATTLARKEAIISGSVDASTVKHVEPEARPEIDWTAIENEAAQALREAAEAAKALAAAKGEHEKKMAERRVNKAKSEARSRVRAAAARRLAEEETETDAPRRGPANDVEAWAISGLRQLAANDQDRAFELNRVGFSKSDGGIGHALAWLDDLTDQEWRLAVRIARVYHRQIGEAPKAAA